MGIVEVVTEVNDGYLANNKTDFLMKTHPSSILKQPHVETAYRWDKVHSTSELLYLIDRLHS